MATCALYKAGGRLLGTGTITNGAVTVGAWSVSSGNLPIARRNVVCTITSSTHAGQSFVTKVVSDNGATLTIRDASPFAT